MKATGTVFSGSVWFQERYFLAALQNEIDSAQRRGSSLCVVVLRLPDYTRKAAQHLFAYAEAEDGNSFFGLLANGDYAICMPDSGYAEAASESSALVHALSAFGACAGVAVLDEELTAKALLESAARDCGLKHRPPFDDMPQTPCCPTLRRLHDR